MGHSFKNNPWGWATVLKIILGGGPHVFYAKKRGGPRIFFTLKYKLIRNKIKNYGIRLFIKSLPS